MTSRVVFFLCCMAAVAVECWWYDQQEEMVRLSLAIVLCGLTIYSFCLLFLGNRKQRQEQKAVEDAVRNVATHEFCKGVMTDDE